MLLILNLIAFASGLVAAWQLSAGKRNFITSAIVYCVVLLIIALYLRYYAEAIFYIASIFFNIITYIEWNKNAVGKVSHASRLTRRGRWILALATVSGFIAIFMTSYAIQHDSNLFRIILIDSILFTTDVAALPLVFKKKTAGPWMWLATDILWNVYLFWFVVLSGNWDYLPLFILRIYFIATTIMAIVLWNRQVPHKRKPTFNMNETITNMSTLNTDQKKKN